MNELKDNSIPIGLSVETSILPFEKPKRFIDIPDSVIKNVSMYMTPVIYNATKNREVNVEKILINSKALFKDGKNYYDKDYWMQHCASSLREIVVFVYPEHFKQAHQNIPDSSDPNVEKLFSFLANTLNYFSSVVHHRVVDRMGDAEKLYKDQGYGSMTKEDFQRKENEFFERVSIDLVYTLNFLFVTYCLNQTN